MIKNQDLPKSAHASAGLVRCSNLHPNIFSFFAATLLECTQKCALDRLKKTAERNKNVDKFLAPSGFRACSSAALCCSGSLLDTLVMAVPHRRKFPSPRHLFQNLRQRLPPYLTKSSRQIQMTHPNTHKTNTLCNTSNILRVHRIDGGNAATSNCQRKHRCCSLCNTSFSGSTMRFQL